jgi:hypothetical protein
MPVAGEGTLQEAGVDASAMLCAGRRFPKAACAGAAGSQPEVQIRPVVK